MSRRQRVWILFRSRLDAGPRGGMPVAALMFSGALSALCCGLVSSALPPFAYGVFALCLATAFIGLPLLGELGGLLRDDETRDWVRSLPVTKVDLRLSRTLYLLACLALMALAALVPAALLAPDATPLEARLAFPLLGLGLASLVAAVLLVVQSVLGGRVEALLIGFQTVLVVGAVVGLVTIFRLVPQLARLPAIGDEHASFLWFLPPAWFAAPLATAAGEPARWWLPAGATLAALAVLALVPAPPPERAARREPWLAWLLEPARRLASALWCRPDERGPFQLVYDALPREREVVLRTYPMVGIPLAFLLIASRDEADLAARRDLLAVLLFTAGIYLPILLTHVPVSASYAASWLLETAPVERGAVVSGTVKALAVRFVLPLYVVLGGIAWAMVGGMFALAFAPAGALLSTWILYKLYRVCVDRLPLSIPADEVRTDLDWIGALGGMALGLTIAAVFARRLVNGPLEAFVLLTLLIGLLYTAQRSLRRLA